MYKVVYFHKTTFGFEEACRQLLRRAKENGLFNVPASGDAIRAWVRGDNFLDFTDAWVDGVVRQAAQHADPLIRALGRCIVYRHPPTLIREVSEMKDLASASNASECKNFVARCQDRIKDLATKLSVDQRLFLIAAPKPVTLEGRSSKFTPVSAKKLEPEEREEVVKIFKKGMTEPVPLVDMPESITHLAANQAYTFARLYLVTEDAAIAQQAREAVASW